MRKQKWNDSPRPLYRCPKCNRDGVVKKVYQTQNETKRIEYCLLPKCGYKQDLPFPETYLRKEGAVC